MTVGSRCGAMPATNFSTVVVGIINARNPPSAHPMGGCGILPLVLISAEPEFL